MTDLDRAVDDLSPSVSRVASLLEIRDETTRVLAFARFVNDLTDVLVRPIPAEDKDMFRAKLHAALVFNAHQVHQRIDWTIR